MLTMTRKEFARRVSKDGSFRNRFQNSSSPGPVSVRLGVSRQRVHQMIDAGILDALKVVEEGNHHPLFIVIFDDSVEAREAHYDPRKKFVLAANR